MAIHWRILVLLTLTRVVLGFQFQALAAVGPQIAAETGFSQATIGALVGIYLSPGILIAIPGGWLGARFGEKRMTLIGLGFMAAGGAMLAVALTAPDWRTMAAARLVAGVGGVTITVMLSKMVADWFVSRGLATGMGVLIMSWPMGIALALSTAPWLRETFGAPAPSIVAAGASLVALVAVALVYRPPDAAPAPGAESPEAVVVSGMTRGEFGRTLLAGGTWALFNVVLILVLVFGPDLLTARGDSPALAAVTVGAVSWAILPSLGLGGWFVDRTGRPDVALALCLSIAGGLAAYLAIGGDHVWVFALYGLMLGPPGAVIMTLPAMAVRAQHRSLSMGIYFTIHYIAMTISPPLAGAVRDRTDASAPIWIAAGCIVSAMVVYAVTRRLSLRA